MNRTLNRFIKEYIALGCPKLKKPIKGLPGTPKIIRKRFRKRYRLSTESTISFFLFNLLRLALDESQFRTVTRSIRMYMEDYIEPSDLLGTFAASHYMSVEEFDFFYNHRTQEDVDLAVTTYLDENECKFKDVI